MQNRKLQAIGFWFSEFEPELPRPQPLVTSRGSVQERAALVRHLESGRVHESYRGCSSCRFNCGIAPQAMGSRDFTDGLWVWPEGLAHYVREHGVERASTIAGDTAEQRRARREEHGRPVLDELRAWLDDKRAVIPPKTPLGRGLGYLHRQWHRLLLFLEDGNIELTNNRRERELRRLVLGRRNWLFAWLDLGGERTACILTIIGTCIAHDVNPRAYLHRVTRLIVQGWPQARLRELLPDRMLAAHPELYIGGRNAVPTLTAE